MTRKESAFSTRKMKTANSHPGGLSGVMCRARHTPATDKCVCVRGMRAPHVCVTTTTPTPKHTHPHPHPPTPAHSHPPTHLIAKKHIQTLTPHTPAAPPTHTCPPTHPSDPTQTLPRTHAHARTHTSAIRSFEALHFYEKQCH